jgi:hypothetical protein
MEQKKQKLPEDLIVLLRQLVVQGQIRIGGTLLFVYLKREWHLEDELAAYYMRRYFEKYYGDHVQKHRQRMTKAQ